MNEQIVQLVLAAMALDPQALLMIKLIEQKAALGDPEAALMFQMIQQVAQLLATKAKLGAKLNYLRTLKGNCPEGYELRSYAIGGNICHKCEKAKKGTEMKEPKNVAEAFKCGRKMKKKEEGGSVEEAKCGSKVKKKRNN